MAKIKKYYVQLQGTKAIEDVIIQLGGAPYDETKKVQQGLLGTMYTSRASSTSEDANTPLTYSLTPEEYALIQSVSGVQRIQ
jgi:hypothetical protein